MVTDFKKNIKAGRSTGFLLHAGGAFILLIFVVLLIANIKIYQKKQEFLDQVESLERQIQDLKNSNEHLEQGISKSSDDQYIEKVAREELDLQKPGETVVSFVTAPIEDTTPDSAKPGFFGAWFGWIGNSWQWFWGAVP